MNIIMITNTYTPHVGGAARSVSAFAEEYRRLGHRVMVIAPEFDNMPEHEENVVRVPAIRHFNGSDFSVRIPIPHYLSGAVDHFHPDIIHSHHSFLLGETALVIAEQHRIPLVFTHHTMYEQYTHYVPGDSPTLKRFIIRLTTGYANLCDHVIAPSESVRAILLQRGVTSPIAVIPTGVDIQRYASRDGHGFRSSAGIPSGAYVVGHVGRLAPEKNLEFLAQAVADFLTAGENRYLLVVGDGPFRARMVAIVAARGVADRVHFAGIVTGEKLVEAYHAMDVFAFASLSETQGMVLAEAMAAGVPVVAIDAPGARETVIDSVNGRLLSSADRSSFAPALTWIAELQPDALAAMKAACARTAAEFSVSRCAKRCLDLYSLDTTLKPRGAELDAWHALLALIAEEWIIWSNRVHAISEAVFNADDEPAIPTT